nr:PREDICTED: eukaryotic translation initiation factor 3 subunit G [Struthio camelus australis]
MPLQIIRTFRIETRKASKAVARRKNWKKFGNSEFDAPGPNVATTTVSDDVFMTFITSKEVSPEGWEPAGPDDNATIRVTNLSEDTRETDLQELFRPFGSISRIYLAKDKTTGQSKGFAFISFHRREDAARAIAGVSGFGYDHLILNVEWAKPSTN